MVYFPSLVMKTEAEFSGFCLFVLECTLKRNLDVNKAPGYIHKL